jgi:hypothetical protein
VLAVQTLANGARRLEEALLADFLLAQPGTAGEAQPLHLQVVLDRHGDAVQ